MKAEILFDIVGGIEDLSIACYDDEKTAQRLKTHNSSSRIYHQVDAQFQVVL